MKKQICKYALVLSLLAAKISLFGFRYFPTLDDYIQYSAYSLYPKNYVLFTVGTIYKRPAAAVFDLFVWQKLGMYFSLVLLTFMLFLSAVFLILALKTAGINLSRFFVLFFLFCPLNFEGTYWISAASRIVTSIFFCAVSLYVFAFAKGKFRIFIFAFFNLLSYLFYEQSLVFSFVTTIVFLCFTNKKFIAVPIINVVLTGVYYIICAPFDRFADRGEIGIKFLPHILSLCEIFTSVFPKMIFKSPHIWISPLIFAVILFILNKFCPPKNFSGKRSIIYAFAVFLCPFTPYFVLKNSYISLRACIFAVMAIGTILDNIPFSKRSSNIIFSALLSLFLISSASELSQYKAAYQTDKAICENLINSHLIEDNKTYYLVGAKRVHNQITAPFAEHILNVTQADWSLTGALRSYSQNKNIKRIIPVSDSAQANENYEKIYIDNNLKISKSE